MGNNNLGWVILIIVIILICVLIWWANSSGKDKSSCQEQGFLRKLEYRMLLHERRLQENFTSTHQNGNTRFETSRSFKLNKSDRYKIVLPKHDKSDKYEIVRPKHEDKEQSYTVSIKFDFSEHKISIQTPQSTPDGRTTDGYVAEIRHHIFEDSMLYDTLNDPVIQPSEINRSTQSRATKISIKKSQDNDLIIDFDISPGVMAIGSMTIRLDSLTPSRQMGNDFAIKNKSDYN